MLRSHALGLMIALMVPTMSAHAQEFKVGDITIDKPWSRATPKGAEVAVGYLIIHNNSATPDKLLGGSADFAGNLEIHEMSMENGIARMRELKEGLEIPAHGEVALSPKGYHIMFTNLKRPLKKGESVKAGLAFEHAGTISVEFKVEGVGDAGPGGASKPAEPMKGMKM